MKVKYFKDTLARDKESYFIVKTINENTTEVIHSHGEFIKDTSNNSKPIWGVGTIHPLDQALADVGGIHIIEEMTEEQIKNWWIHDI
ncbi:MAG: hypothetical protein IMZ52_01565 [Actinobacteria bacterium]|nr:hypothetical protein [Actinomycetota bacterium]MBE3114830.1 hypothetical protein [Actinomycetota bacterium]